MAILGNRVPYEYFITQGKGESDAGSNGLPYETGSYDATLFNAGIQNVNVIEYTSVMSTNSKEIPKTRGSSDYSGAKCWNALKRKQMESEDRKLTQP